MQRPSIQDRAQTAQDRRHSRVQSAIDRRKKSEAAIEIGKSYVYDQSLDALTVVRTLDELIDATSPEHPGSKVSDAFCEALKAREAMLGIVEDLAIAIEMMEEP